MINIFDNLSQKKSGKRVSANISTFLKHSILYEFVGISVPLPGIGPSWMPGIRRRRYEQWQAYREALLQTK